MVSLRVQILNYLFLEDNSPPPTVERESQPDSPSLANSTCSFPLTPLHQGALAFD